MPAPRVLILRAPGTNCDRETAFAFERAGGRPSTVHVNGLLERAALLDEFEICVIPGGFSYGDDIAAGRILANQFRLRLADALRAFRDANRLILGICNGFQTLLQSGLFDDVQQQTVATLTWNDSGRFEDRWVRLAVTGTCEAFLRGIEEMYLPVAHAEGKFVPASETMLNHLDGHGRLVIRYQGDRRGGEHVAFPDNPNGSVADVAGICDETGRVLGLMPHPERYIERTHHPRWTREELPEAGDGLRLLQNAVEYFA